MDKTSSLIPILNTTAKYDGLVAGNVIGTLDFNGKVMLQVILLVSVVKS